MVLMAVIPPVCEDQVGIHPPLGSLELILDGGPLLREIAFPELRNGDPRFLQTSKEISRAGAGLLLALAAGTENLPVNLNGWELRRQSQQRPAATDFNVIRVSPEAEHPPDRFLDSEVHDHERKETGTRSIRKHTICAENVLSPDHPRCAAGSVEILQDLPLAESVHAGPEAVVAVGHQLV